MRLSGSGLENNETKASGVSAWSRFYLPEIHDLHPGMMDRFETLLGLLPSRARQAASLLVVPCWPGEGEMPADRKFCRILAALPGEKVLHGWSHSLGRSFLNWLFYGHDNRSEFAGLDEKNAKERLRHGKRAFKAGFLEEPSWFCAPRWLQSKATTRALIHAGFKGYMLYDGLQFCSGLRMPLPVISFDEGERKLRRAVARRLRGRKIEKLMSTAKPFRLSLHPTDPDDPATWRQASELIARLEKDGWTALSLAEAVSRWERLRTSGPGAPER